MSIVDLQLKARRLGEIRLGDTMTKNGKTFPVSLDTFRLTSAAKGLLDQAAELWGGKVVPWQASPNTAAKWQVVTDTNELPVFVAPQDPDSVTWYESWTQGGLQRRCDGESIVSRTEHLACVCDPDNRECKMVTRLQVMLPDLPDVGVWTLSSTGFYAASEMAMSIQIVMQSAQVTGALPEAVLAIEHRESKTPGQPTKKFVVPVLRFADSLGSFMEQTIALPQGPAHHLPDGADGGEGEGTVQSLPEPSPTNPQPVVEGEVFDASGVEYSTVTMEDPEAVLVVPSTYDDATWGKLLKLLEDKADEGTMSVVESRVRTLFRYMEQTGLWPDSDGALHASLAKHNGVEHLTDLRKAELGEFAVKTFDAARVKVGEDD